MGILVCFVCCVTYWLISTHVFFLYLFAHFLAEDFAFAGQLRRNEAFQVCEECLSRSGERWWGSALWPRDPTEFQRVLNLLTERAPHRARVGTTIGEEEEEERRMRHGMKKSVL